ncbi:hypothetical protein NUSPORA_01844 [Nucleospora cyclopteri]
MKILSISICNYKSFKGKHKILLGNKNIIVGRNGTGKSNFLQSIFSLFLMENVQNSLEKESFVEIELENKERKFCVEEDFVKIKMDFTGNSEMENRNNLIFRSPIKINGKTITKGEFQGLLESAGFNFSGFVSQGENLMENPEEAIFKVSGASQFEEFKKQALKSLNEGEIDELMEKLDYKALKYREFSEKYKKFSELDQERKSIEYKLALLEVNEITEEIEKMKKEQIEFIGEEEVEMQLKAIQEEINEKAYLLRNFKEKRKSGKGENKSSMKQNKLNLTNKLREVQNKVNSNKIEIKAVEYFEAAGTKKEDVEILTRRIEAKRAQLEGRKSVTDLVEAQKKLWLQERRLSEDLKLSLNKLNSINKKLPYLGNDQINLYESIKEIQGVVGPVYELLTINQKYLPAFEAVARNALFYVVVENENSALECIKRIKGRMTFINLNSENLKLKTPSNGTLCNVILEDKISPSYIKYPTLLRFLCRDVNLFPEISKALSHSNATGGPAVTLSGEFVSRRGIISGGHERSNSTLLELMETKNTCNVLEKEMEKIKEEIRNVAEEIFISKGEGNVCNHLSLKAHLRFLEYKLEINTKKQIKLPDLEALQGELTVLEAEQHKISSQLQLLQREVDQIEEEEKRSAEENKLKLECSNLRDKEGLLMKILLGEKIPCKENQARTNILLEKRANVMRKFNINKLNCIVNVEEKHELIIKLKCIVNALKPYSVFGFSGRSFEKVLDIEKVKDSLRKMKMDRGLIVEYMEYLQGEKETRVNFTFKIIADHFREIYFFITGEEAEIEMTDKKLSLIMHKQPITIKSLSGGQKAVFSLSLMLAIQRTDPSPFYVFDEIDANLDKSFASKVYELIRKTDAQFIISSFKEQSLICGDKFYGVVLLDKKSEIGEISKSVAYETISYNKI